MTPNLAANIDWSRYRPTPLRVAAACALLLAVSIGVAFVQYSNARDLIIPAGTAVGGDYVAFDVAAHEAVRGGAADIYDPAHFEARLLELGPPRERYGLTFQYPPTYLLVIAPLAFLGFVPGYLLWTGATAAAFFASLRSAGLSALFLFVALAAPSTFHAVITGQNGFLTAALLVVAAYFARSRPALAGLAAALLTVKPQLGLLLPIAYLAGGCWRAFFYAAAGAVALAGASLFAFGAESWVAFFQSLRGVWGNVETGLMPLYKMASPYAAARMAGLPGEIAMAFQAGCALAAALSVGFVWRRTEAADLRAAVLLAGVFLAAPYVYYYEFVILALPLAALAKRGLCEGWLKYEQIAIAAVFLTPLLLPGEARRMGVPFFFILVLITWASVLRRALPEALSAKIRPT